MKKIVFFGDSICFGQGISIQNGWIPRFASFIESMTKKNKSQSFIIRNNSVNGDTTRKALERINYDVFSQGVEIAIIQFGLNDCNFWKDDKGLPRVLPNSFKENLIEIITRLIHHKCEHIFLLTNHPTKLKKNNKTDSKYDKNNRTYNHLIRAVSKKFSRNLISLVDIEKYFINKSIKNCILSDGIHLNLKGHDLYLEIFLDKFKKHLNRKKS